MTWEMAFTIVGSTWALVAVFAINTDRRERTDNQITDLQAKCASHGKEIDWLKGCYRKLIGIEK